MSESPFGLLYSGSKTYWDHVKVHFDSGTKCVALENLSMMVSMNVLLSDIGNPMTKTTAIWDQGWSVVGAAWLEVGCYFLFWAQVEQAATNSLTVLLFSKGHQKCILVKSSRQFKPGWQVNFDRCTQSRTLLFTKTGTQNLEWGPVPGSISICWASLTSFSMDQVLTPIGHKGRIIFSSVLGRSEEGNWWDRASGLTAFLELCL